MTHIVPMILERITAHLQDVLIDDIPFSDPTHLSAVKVGRFQEDPGGSALRASVLSGDLDDLNVIDGIVGQSEAVNNRMAFRVAQREIGGTQMWWRKGTVRLELFFIVDQIKDEKAREYAYTILGRLESNLEKVYLTDLYDEHGEHAIVLFHTQSQMIQSGGPPASYLYRGKAMWDVLTER